MPCNVFDYKKMKNTHLLFTALIVIAAAACTSGKVTDGLSGDTTSNENGISWFRTEDIHINNDSLTYVLFFPQSWWNRVLDSSETDSTMTMDDLYTAQDDMLWYNAMCRNILVSLGANYYEADSEIDVYYSGGVFHATRDSNFGRARPRPCFQRLF